MPDFPSVFRVRQKLEGPRLENVSCAVNEQLSKLTLQETIKPGQTVAVTAGSRGIANNRFIIKAIVDHLRGFEANPFIVPAMGSHAGGTAEGQRQLIEEYGITDEFCGCPIRSSMDTVTVCQAAEGFPVYFDRMAYDADHVVVCGRVKPHTNFTGDVESGLLKMMLIGLGKHEGAKIYHRAIHDYSFSQIVRSVAHEVLDKCRIVAGLAIVENAKDETAVIEAVQPAEFEQREKELLLLARQWMPRLPFDQADILLIDEIGKDVSGTGLDTNVVGRKFGIHQAAEDEYPKIRNIAIRGLTEATHGNAAGLGMAEFCLARALRQRDEAVTRINCLTGGHGILAMTPLDYETDFEIMEAAMPSIGLTEPPNARLMWIRNTLSVAELECSAAYWLEALERQDLEILREPRPLPFDADGNLPNFMTELF